MGVVPRRTGSGREKEGEGRTVELEAVERSDRSGSPVLRCGNARRAGRSTNERILKGTPLNALFRSVVRDLSPFPSAFPHLPPPREPR
jgi:hypothetical protein